MATCSMSLPNDEIKSYESQLMDSSDVLTSRQIAMAHALPLQSAVCVLASLYESNPKLQTLYLTTKNENGKTKISLTESKESGEGVSSSVLYSLCGSKETKALEVMALTTMSVRGVNGNNIKADVERIERKRKGGSVSGAQSGAGERSDGHMSLKSNPFGQKRVKVSAENFFGGASKSGETKKKKKSVFDSNPKAPKPKKNIFATTKVKAKKGKKKVEKKEEKVEEVKLGKEEMSKRKVLDSDSEDEDEDEEDDGTGFLDVGEKLPPPPAADDDDGEEEFVGDEESDDEEKGEAEKTEEGDVNDDEPNLSPEKKTKRKKKDEKYNEFGEEIVKEKVVGAMDKAFGGGSSAGAGEGASAETGGKRRVIKKRFVEKTEMDANGYIHTTTVEEEYSDYEEGTPPKKQKEETVMKRSSGVGGGIAPAKEKKQKGLIGFFSAKPKKK